jgi:biopolymer transport protein ExbD
VAVTLKETHDADLQEMSDINVTPFIDVMLVLLIIFMVAAPLSTVDVSVDLPVSNAETQPRPDKPIFLTLKGDLSLALADDAIASDALQSVLDREIGGDRSRRIYLRADRAVAYGEFMKVMKICCARLAISRLRSSGSRTLKALQPRLRPRRDFRRARWRPRSDGRHALFAGSPPRRSRCLLTPPRCGPSLAGDRPQSRQATLPLPS